MLEDKTTLCVKLWGQIDLFSALFKRLHKERNCRGEEGEVGLTVGGC